MLVAVAAGDGGTRLVAGFASFGPATDPDRWPATDAELYELCVAQDQAGRGHGSRLLNAAAATLAEDGFGTVSAWVLERDAAARRFLESSGWAADGSPQRTRHGGVRTRRLAGRSGCDRGERVEPGGSGSGPGEAVALVILAGQPGQAKGHC